ncbi:Benzoyl-CoA reductase/2-hydroxyglutaryl-CoA dehydratase subunit, BcrC/BadD/HgdB [Desulfacinum hydrothermale DSM 13146]|uniref:Benzoyl-CoA reductase/2-hydroxyglutaryl-CoA dehydratase subunit, BcrC/BadD/HgdB n=1 Tax=Desulfacinum hydrothermale DSM 13146 TaxID=1121390 RepID=A0A1W1XKG0_9BACT|nr:2-hydroxyacyl-CoA dehydratase family protein [Desulfacinum hydrothermale]SMC23988.1 Benzoyl-CoA reductase/2-hydroxyglutaryl-CoA dehydratase subunit, BcrC/BadD/HgdB [Desulfacinum hydrothermale DSM 13146]
MDVRAPSPGACRTRSQDEVPAVGWLCSAVPEELLIAAGAEPRRLYGYEARGEGSESLLPTTFCAYVHGVLQAALQGAFASLAAVVVVNSCDAMRRLADLWQRQIKEPPVFRLDFPFGFGSAAEDYWVAALKHLVRYLEDLAGRPIKDSDLQGAIAVMNETRRRVMALDRLRAQPLRGISGVDYSRWLVKAFVGDKRRFLSQSAPILAEWEAAANGAGPAPPRLVLGGCAADTVHLVQVMEACGTQVVADTLCTGSRHFDTLVEEWGDSVRAVARRYLRRAPCARRVDGSDFVGHLLRRVRETRADGVVFPTLKFCDMVRWRLPRLAAVMAQEGIPFLHVERDGSAASWGQMQTRIQAFVEMIETRRAAG